MFSYARVLIVDSNKTDREDLRFILGVLGVAKIIEAQNPSDAWEQLNKTLKSERKRVHLLFLNVPQDHPEPDLVLRIMNDPILSEMKIVILDKPKGKSRNKAQLAQVLKQGAIGWITSPYKKSQIKKVLHKVL